MPTRITLLPAVFLVTASMLGSGILTTTGSILSIVKSPSAVLAVWALAGLHACIGAYCYGLIVKRNPVNGGEASILKTYFSRALGEIAGWVSFVVGFAASNAASAIGFGAYVEKAFPRLNFGVSASALGAILMVTAMHSLIGPLGLRLQTAMAALKFLMLATVTAWGLSQAAGDLAHTPVDDWTAAPFGPGWGLAIMFSMFAYLGWSAAIYSAAETHEPKRTVPRAMLVGTIIVLVLYLGVNVALLKHIALGELAKEKAVLELLVRKLFGDGASRAFAGVVSFALLSSLGASAFLGPRVLHAMLLWSRPVHKESPERELPEISWKLIWIQALLSMGMILSGTFEQILTVTGFLLGIFPILAVLSLYTSRANESERVPFRARGFAIPAFVAGSLLILVLGAIERPGEMAVASGVVFLIVFMKHQLARSGKLSN